MRVSNWILVESAPSKRGYEVVELSFGGIGPVKERLWGCRIWFWEESAPSKRGYEGVELDFG
ncbi:hypothetical protein BSG1_12976 [Bacillus sp. SG-1]|nr:hypothetical protein BSG1_12976 [Bacillus sp. SG-1]